MARKVRKCRTISIKKAARILHTTSGGVINRLFAHRLKLKSRKRDGELRVKIEHLEKLAGAVPAVEGNNI